MAENVVLEQAYKNEKIATFENVSIFFYQAFNHSYGVLHTKGMSNVNQHIRAGKSEQIYPFIELYFLLPSYWDIKKENQKWPLTVLNRLIDAQVNKSVWFGPGDTLRAHPKAIVDDNIIDNTEDTLAPPINSTFKQNYFILSESIAAEPHLKNIKTKEEPINWLGIIPIFQKEFDYKTRRSALELMMSFDKKKVTELIDEHRPIAIKKRFFGLFY